MHSIQNAFIFHSTSFFKIAPIMVTDFSWALIRSAMRIFNNCDPYDYLNWTYEILIQYGENDTKNKYSKFKIDLNEV